ncbi:hypothetical protein V8E52_008505 [Russula decolorans]
MSQDQEPGNASLDSFSIQYIHIPSHSLALQLHCNLHVSDPFAPELASYHSKHVEPFTTSPTGGDSGSSYSEQGRTILPPLTIAFPTSDSPGSLFNDAAADPHLNSTLFAPFDTVSNNYTTYPTAAQRSTPVPEQPYYPPAQQQPQTHAPYPAYPAYPAYQQLSDARYHSSHGQTHGSSYNRASPASGSADPWRPPRFDVPDDGRSQGQPYYTSHADLQIPPTSSDWRSSHSAYPSTSGFPQYQSPTSPAYPPGHNPSQARAAVPTAHTHYHQQPMAVSHASLERNIPSSRGVTQLPYARTATSAPSPVPYDIPAETPEPTIKKKRKRADARQLDALNRMYARTAFPSTEERLQLAKDLDMSARSTFSYVTSLSASHRIVFTGSRFTIDDIAVGTKRLEGSWEQACRTVLGNNRVTNSTFNMAHMKPNSS